MGGDPSRAHGEVRPCRSDEADKILRIINAAATIYEGVIPADCWHDPYMSAEQLASDMAAGVVFWGTTVDGALAGVMGFQRVRDVDLVRHAYVRPSHQGLGIGALLIRHLEARSAAPILIGTWAAASWAIGFYERHGYRLVPAVDKDALLRSYWTVSQRQIEASVVLAKPAFDVAVSRPPAL